ncbi:hypothetical protein ACFY12_11975 [Streptomyces sp. NPDC001339]|uniref:hypothetical protein n=1 Tax=Streptomyces sp. NPDC001339 TaxID=3364563 RepID=UPI0036B655E1
MSSVIERYRALEEYIAGDRRVAVADLVDVPAADLRQADEHDVAVLLLLGELCARMADGTTAAPTLLETAERYVNTSFFYTGRILPRTRELIELLGRAVRERSLDLLTEVADHLSQGWAGYADSVFPTAFMRLADASGLKAKPELFSRVSFVLWNEGLKAAAANAPERALPLFRDSLERYRRYRYYADASWLHTDLVITQLLAGNKGEASAVLEAQRDYVEEVLAAHPPTASDAGRRFAFHLGDVQSGTYSTFVESSALRPTELTERDRELLMRYVHTSEFLISACRYGARRDFDAALDVFSFGWATYQQSPYPRMFQHLADRYLQSSESWNVHLTAYERWHRMLCSYRVRVKPHVLIDTAATLHDRLGYAGLEACASLILLDTAVLHARLHGRSDAVDWITRYLRDLRPTVPETLGAVVDYLQAPQSTERRRLLSRYIGLRADHLAPEFLSLDLGDEQLPEPNRLEVTLYGPLLSVEGITVHEITPKPLIDILRVLGREFTQSRAEGLDVPLLSAAELSQRTNRTSAALAQTVRRFRGACQERFHETTNWDIIQDAIIQGRPGYRLNPQNIYRFVEYSTESS